MIHHGILLQLMETYSDRCYEADTYGVTIMTSFADLIIGWINAHPSRSAAALSRLAGISRAEITFSFINTKSPLHSLSSVCD